MKFYGFSADYIQRLRAGDAAVEEHFTAYFGELIYLKLRGRLRSHQLIEDIRQETLLRVLRIVQEGGLEHPERLGAFVNAVSNNVMLELLRQENRLEQMQPAAPDPADGRVDLDLPLINEERKRLVEAVLGELSWRDRQILRLLYLEEKSSVEVCSELRVDPDYLRVLAHRAGFSINWAATAIKWVRSCQDGSGFSTNRR